MLACHPRPLRLRGWSQVAPRGEVLTRSAHRRVDCKSQAGSHQADRDPGNPADPSQTSWGPRLKSRAGNLNDKMQKLLAVPSAAWLVLACWPTDELAVEGAREKLEPGGSPCSRGGGGVRVRRCIARPPPRGGDGRS